MADADAAFRTFAVDPPYAARTLRKLIQQRRNELIGHLAGGYCLDWAEYKKRVGVLEGLDDAARMCDDMEKQEKK